MSRNNYLYSISAVALSLGLSLLGGTGAGNANLCVFQLPNRDSVLHYRQVIGGTGAFTQKCSSYDLTFGGGDEGDESVVMTHSDDRVLRLEYYDRIGPVNINLVIPEFSGHRFSIDLYLGDSKITEENNNDRFKRFTFQISNTASEQARRVAYFGDPGGRPTHGWHELPWEGSIKNIGDSTLTFEPKLDRSNPDEFRTINFYWSPSRSSESNAEFYIKTRKYSFENPYENSIFHVGVTHTDRDLRIPAGGELAIHSGVALELRSTRLLFEEALSNPAPGQPNEPGKLKFVLSSKDRPFGYRPVSGGTDAIVPPTGPGSKITYPFLLIKSPPNNLVLRRLELAVGSAFHNDDDWSDGSLLLVKIENPTGTSNIRKICFVDENCDAVPGRLLYLLPALRDNSALVIEISDDRTQLLLRPPRDDETGLPGNSRIIVTDYGGNQERSTSSGGGNRENGPPPDDDGRKSFREYLLVDNLLDNVSTTLVQDTHDISPSKKQTPSAQAQTTALVAPIWDGDIALSISSSFQQGWAAAGANQGQHQYLNLHIGGRYRQFGMGATGFYTRVVIDNEPASDLVGGLVKMAYSTPLAGLSTNLYFGGGLTPQKSSEYRVIITGIALNYQYSFTQTVNIILAPSLRLDIAPLFAKADSTSDFAVQKLPVRLQGGIQAALDTSDLITDYRLKFSVPLKFGITGYFGLDENTKHSYEMYGAAGLDVQLTALENLVVEVGYSLRYGKIHTKHLLNVRVQFQM